MSGPYYSNGTVRSPRLLDLRPCQVVDSLARNLLPCKHRESGGIQCERLDAHGDAGHAITMHTIEHSRAGNGYACGIHTGCSA